MAELKKANRQIVFVFAERLRQGLDFISLVIFKITKIRSESERIQQISLKIDAERLGVNRSGVGHILTGECSLSLIESTNWFEALDVSPAQFYELLDKGVGIEEDWVKKKKP